jgi:hypothetical protein
MIDDYKFEETFTYFFSFLNCHILVLNVQPILATNCNGWTVG